MANLHTMLGKHQFGRVLIDKESIVTAAHSVHYFITRAPVTKLQIAVGTYDIEEEQ